MLITFLIAIVVASAAQAPVRDAPATPQKGTAVIKGRVVTLEGERPLRRAQITAMTAGLSEAVRTSTDAFGVFELTELPAGRYTISVNRSGYVPLQFGQVRPGEPAKPVVVGDGEVVDHVNFALPRAAAISGRISDEMGEPFSGVSVWAVQIQYFRGRRRFVPVGAGSQGNRTDDTGQYRLIGLPPGEYYVMGTTRETWSVDEEQKQLFGYAASYFPGVVSGADAQRVKLTMGQDLTGVDFSMIPMRAASVSGTAFGSDGAPMAGADVYAGSELSGPTFMTMGMGGSAKVAPDGSWVVRNLPPGDYQVRVTSVDRDRPPESAVQIITVQGVDVDGVALVPDAGATIAGQVVTDDGSALPAARLRVTTQIAGAERMPMAAPPAPPDNGIVGPGGAFESKGPSGRGIVRVQSLPQGWAIRRVEVNRVDQTRTPLELASGRRVEGVTVVLTKRLAQVAGRLLDERGNAVDGTAILFPADKAFWIEAAGTLRSARPDQSGTYRFENVLPGDYLIVALDYVQPWQVVDPEFLEELKPRATTVTVGEATGQPIDLVVRK